MYFIIQHVMFCLHTTFILRYTHLYKLSFAWKIIFFPILKASSPPHLKGSQRILGTSTNVQRQKVPELNYYFEFYLKQSLSLHFALSSNYVGLSDMFPHRVLSARTKQKFFPLGGSPRVRVSHHLCVQRGEKLWSCGGCLQKNKSYQRVSQAGREYS